MRVIVANAKSGSNRQAKAYAEWTRRQGGIGLHCEAHNMRPEFIKQGLNTFTGDATATQAESFKGPRENVVTLPAHVTVESSRTVKLSPFVSKRNAADRWCQEVRAVIGTGEDARKVALFAVHANAAIYDRLRRRTKTTPGARAWLKGLDVLGDLIEAAKTEGYDVVVGGDFNYREGYRGDANPRHLFGRLGLTWRSDELMWLAWTPGYAVVEYRALPKPPGSDHIAIRVDLTPTADLPPQGEELPVPVDPALVEKANALTTQARAAWKAAGYPATAYRIWQAQTETNQQALRRG